MLARNYSHYVFKLDILVNIYDIFIAILYYK
jgi:hypothetical protein